jgi:amino-acid N-acetyltransferase
MTTATLAPLRPEQWPHLTTLLTQAGLPIDGLADHRDATLVALDGNTVIGSVALEVYGRVALLRSLAVAPDRQGQGIGAQLFDAALAMAQARGIHTLYLLTETAAPYFERRRFVPITRAEVDPAVTASVEFTDACPASAQAMRLALTSTLHAASVPTHAAPHA